MTYRVDFTLPSTLCLNHITSEHNGVNMKIVYLVISLTYN